MQIIYAIPVEFSEVMTMARFSQISLLTQTGNFGMRNEMPALFIVPEIL